LGKVVNLALGPYAFGRIRRPVEHLAHELSLDPELPVVNGVHGFYEVFRIRVFHEIPPNARPDGVYEEILVVIVIDYQNDLRTLVLLYEVKDAGKIEPPELDVEEQYVELELLAGLNKVYQVRGFRHDLDTGVLLEDLRYAFPKERE